MDIQVHVSKDAGVFGLLHDFVEDEAGTTGIDYGLVTAIVAAVVFSAFAALGEDFPNFLNQVGCMITGQASCGSTPL